ncbi:MAG: phospho-sugar mutase, partial [Clostridia bacterium]|nr:phospho-sugar mutase [Clostridia bacterium]
SHNPPEYNGYKLYDERGCQFVPCKTDMVLAEIQKISDPLTVKALPLEQASDWITVLGDEVDESYYKAIASISLNPNVKKDIKIVYSPQHGTGNIPVRTLLERFGYHVIPVLEQCDPDPDFSNTKDPNPESEVAYELPIQYAKKYDADIIITNDPDCDRLGVAVKRGDAFVRMTGNQSAAVLLEYILSSKKRQGTLPQNGVMFNTVVTSDLGDRICADYGIVTEKTLTGFKFIGDKIYQHEVAQDKTFVFGYEESYGCLIADFVRDKDAVQASVMLCEAAAYYHEKGKTLFDVLDELYRKYGVFVDALETVKFKGLDVQQKTTTLMNTLRDHPPKAVGGIAVSEIQDFSSEDMIKKGFGKSNVLKFIFADGSWVAVRPSGTEPKCKFYYSPVADDEKQAKKKLDEMRSMFMGYTERI